MNTYIFPQPVRFLACWFPCFVTLGWLLSADVFAQQKLADTEQRKELAQQIRLAIEERQQVREQMLRAEELHQQKVSTLRRQVEDLERQKESIEQAVVAQRQDIARREAEIDAQEQISRSARAWIMHVNNIAKPVIERARQRIAASGGSQQQRLVATLDVALASLAENESTPNVEGLRAFFGVMADEWLPARSVIMSNEPVALEENQREVHAWVVEIGRAARIFLSETGESVGVASGNREKPWILELSTEDRQRILMLVDVLNERSPPAVIEVPVFVAPRESEN